MKALNELQKGQQAKIKELPENKSIRLQMMALGFEPGTTIQMESSTNWAGPLTISASNRMISIRNYTAQQILVESIKSKTDN